MGQFSNWFQKKFKASRYPMPNELKGYDYVINVSDEYIESVADAALQNGAKYFWFPLSEANDNMGLNSIFGALQIIWIAEAKNKSVMVFCHAGSNRSVTIAKCYYFMRTKKYPILKKRNEELDAKIEAMFVFDDENDRIDYRGLLNNSRLENNIIMGHLPSKMKMEDFLKKCEKTFIAYTIASGGKLDTLKKDSKTQSY